MAVAHATVSVGTSATKISVNGADDADKAESLIVSTSGADVFVGGPGVTTSAYGFKVTSTSPLAVDLGSGDVLYAVAAAATDVYILRVGV